MLLKPSPQYLIMRSRNDREPKIHASIFLRWDCVFPLTKDQKHFSLAMINGTLQVEGMLHKLN